jgi:ATP-binding cassette, subfamily B, bacterial
VWNDPLPEGVELPEEPRLCVKADLLPDGAFGEEWLVVTGDRVLVYGPNGVGPGPRLDFPLAEVSEPEVRLLIGGGALDVSHSEFKIELVRYTTAQAGRFATAAQVLGKWLKDEEAQLPEEDARHCPKCGLPLEKGSKVCPACMPRAQALRRLLGYLRPHWKGALGLSLFAVVSTALGMLPIYLQIPLFDQVLAPKGEPQPMPERVRLLGLLVAALVTTRVVLAVLGVAQSWVSAWLGNRVTHDIRCQLYEHLQYLSLSYFDKRQMGTVISRVNQDTNQLQQFLLWGSQEIIIDLLLLFGIGTMLFVINWKLAIFVIIPAPLVALYSVTFFRRIRRYMHRVWHRWGRLNALLNESLSGLRVVKAFAQEPREIARFRDRSEDLAVTTIYSDRLWNVAFSGISLLIMLAGMFVWYMGGRYVLSGVTTIGKLTAIMSYVGMFFQPVQSLSMLINWASRSLTAAERIFEVLDTEPELQEAEDIVEVGRLEGKVEFRNVSFGYEKHRPVLKKVSFEVKPGEMIGLVGHSGAGKTTTINLLCRFYDASDGEILIDDIPIRKIRLADLRHQIGIVPQDTFMFSGTIAENISYGKAGASREEIIRAAKVANAHEFVTKKPDGYETVLGEGGQGLSAGERQRLVIARAVLHDPRILILDEATSQVDIETERQIQEAISRLVHDRTTFAIAHRLSTLRNADRLVVLKDGEIVESGTHDQLLKKPGGEFRRLVEMYQSVSKVREVQR